MASQLVYTSAAKLLDAGRSGFGTVARSKALSPLVVSALERVSQFANLRGTDRSRMIMVYRRLIVGNHRCHVLSRICDAGADYTGRTNHIAHHLIVSPDEVARAAARGVTPADVLQQFAWLDRWDEAARFLGPDDEVAVENFIPDGRHAARAAWSALTGHPAHARLLAWDGAPRTGVLLVPRAAAPLALMAEALCEFGPQAWSRTFTTALESTDELADLDWIITSPATFPEIQGRCGARVLLDLSQPATLPLPPEPVAAVATTPHVPEPEPAAVEVQAATPAPVPRFRPDPGPANRLEHPAVAPATRPLAAWIIAGSATVVMLGILAVAAWQSFRPPAAAVAAPETAPVVRLTDSQLDAVNILRDAGLPQDAAATVAAKSEDQARAWATFISRFCRTLKTGGEPRQLPPPPATKEPDGVPAWLTTLTTASNEISAFLRDSTKGAELTARLESLQQIHGQLRSVTGDLTACGLSNEACDRLDRSLVATALEQLPVTGPAAATGGLAQALAQLQPAIADGQFSRESWPARHRLLVGFVSDHFGLNERQTTAFAATGVVPEGLMKRLQRPGGRPGRPAANSGSAPNLAQVPPRAVILVSRLQLAQGVAVGLLKKIIDANLTPGAAQFDLAPLTLELTPRDRENEATALHLADDKSFYCWTKFKAERAPHFAADGRFSLQNPGVKAIHFRCDQHDAIVVVNERGEEWLRDSLSVELKPRGEVAVVTGELAEWLKAVDAREPADGLLDWRFVPDNPELVVTADGAAWQVGLRPHGQAALVFAAAHVAGIGKALEEFKGKAALSGGTRNAKMEIEKDRQDALAKLQQALCIALGGGLLGKDLALPDASAITSREMGKVRDFLAQKYGLTGAAAPPIGKDTASDLALIEEAIGRLRLDEELPKLGKKLPWSEIAKPGASAVWIEDHLKAILKDAKPPERTTPLAEQLNKTTHLTVSTRAGRALFKAIRR